MTGLPTTRGTAIGVDVIVAPDHVLRWCRTVRRAASGLAAVLTVGLVSYGVIANRTVEGIPEPARAPLVSTTGPASDAPDFPTSADPHRRLAHEATFRVGPQDGVRPEGEAASRM
jgi:hypothetical protein